MKIVVIGTRGFPDVQGGVEKHCQQLYPLVTGMGVDVTVLTRRPYVDPALREYRGVHLVPVDCPQSKFLEAIVHSFRAVLYARTLKPDVVHIHAIGPSIVVPLARLLGLKVVITHHGPDYERKKWNGVAKAILRLGEACGCLFANRIITITGHIGRAITAKFGKVPVIIPNGVVIPEKIVAADTVARFALEPGKYFVAVGRFVPEKGFHDLVDAYARCEAHGWKLVIVGDADHEDAYSRSLKARAAGVSGVVLTGFLTGKALGEIYSNAGVFVLPSYYEGLPIVLLEAMSYGLNCLVSDIPANREVALAQERYVKPGAIDAWAQNMALFSSSPLQDDARTAMLGLIAREYDWKDIARRTLAVYQSV